MPDDTPMCDYGCGRKAHFKNFPQIVHGRLYYGPTCERCAMGTQGDIVSALKDMRKIYDKEDLEYEKLTDNINAQGKTWQTYADR